MLFQGLQLKKKILEIDSFSQVAPYRIVNIGNSKKIKLLDFIEVIEKILGKKAIRNYLPMQKGDAPVTLADTSLLQGITNFSPKTNFEDGIINFVKWYRQFYNI